MLEINKTRVVLNSKILKDVSKCILEFDFNQKNPTATVILKNNDIIKANFLKMDTVEENAHDKKKETIYWSQIILEN